jgi:hypothetical protein
MTNEEFTPAAEGGLPTDRRPLGYWLRVVDRLIAREFATAFEGEDVSRRDWMLLNLLSGDIDAPGLAARLRRGGKRLRRLEERGWVTRIDDGWQLTDEGRTAQERLAEIVQGVRAKVSSAVTPEDWATLTTSLEAIARALGWDESERMPRAGGFGRGSRGLGFGPRHGRFGHGFGPAHGCGHDHDHGHGHGHDHDHGPVDRASQRAYERGFDAGFARGRDSASAA